MSQAAQFTGEIPKNYNEGLVPVLFAPYAEDLTARAARLKPKIVLELAAGTGVVTKTLRTALPDGTSILATDLNDAMLELARPQMKDTPNLSFEVVDAVSIPKESDSFDLLIAQFGVMFVPDKVESFREALRVLKPGGTYLFNAWDSWAKNPWAQLTHETIEAFFPGDAPAFYKVPFHYHDPDEIRRDLEAAGFINVIVERVEKTGKISSHDTLANAAVFGNPIADEMRALTTGVTPEEAREAVRAALEATFGPAPTEMPLSALVVSAQKPGGKRKGFLARLFG